MKAKLLHIFMMDFSRGWGVREHSHAFYQIWYILAGQAEYLLDGKRVTIHANDMVFMPPGISHELPVMQEDCFVTLISNFGLMMNNCRKNVPNFR